MKRKQILTFLLLLAMSFQVLHAFAIDALDSHSCEVSEYVVEFSQPISDDITGDICKIHAEFHTAFIIPENIVLTKETSPSEKPLSSVQIYEFSSNQHLLKPPRT